MPRISEALAIFRLENRFSREKITPEFVSEINRYARIDVGDPLPAIPTSWKESERFLPTRQFSYERLCFEEVIIDHLMRKIVDDAFDRLMRVVIVDLCKILQGMFHTDPSRYQRLLKAKKFEEVLDILREFDPDFLLPHVPVREMQEIMAIRHAVLASAYADGKLDQLRKEGEGMDSPKEPLVVEVKEILDFLVSLSHANYFRGEVCEGGIEVILDELEEFKEELEHSRPGVISRLVPYTPPPLKKMEIAPVEPPSSPNFDDILAGVQEIVKQGAQDKAKTCSQVLREVKSKYKSRLVKETKSSGRALFKKCRKDFLHLKWKFFKDAIKGYKGKVGELGREMIGELETRLFSEFSLGNLLSSHLPMGISGFAGQVLPIGLSLAKGIFDSVSSQSKFMVDHFKQMHKGLHTVNENLFIISEQIKEVDRKIVVIADNQFQLWSTVMGVASQIERQHHEVMIKLATMHHDVILSRAVLSTFLDQSGKKCREARAELMRFDGYLPHFNRFISYEACQRFYRRERFYLKGGLKGLVGLLMRPGENDAALVVSSKQNPNEQLYFEHFRELWKCFQRGISVEEMKAFDLLLETTTHVGQIDAVSLKTREGGKVSLPEWVQHRLKWIDLDTLIRSPYDIGQLLDYAESARCFHYFYELFADEVGGSLVPEEKLEEHHPGPYGERLMQDVFIRLQVGIAQLNLLSGFGVIPSLYETMKKEGLNKVAPLLGMNKLLATNFMIYTFRKQIEEKKGALSDYWFPYLSEHDSHPLKRLLGEEWNFVWDEGQWKVKFSEKIPLIDLPHPVKVINGELEIHPQLGELHMMRKKVLRELAGYQTKDEREEDLGKVWKMEMLVHSTFYRRAIGVQNRISAKL